MQLWCVRKQLATEIPGTLNALSAIGFEAVELENAFGKSGTEWRKYLDAAKLKPCGFHHRLEVTTYFAQQVWRPSHATPTVPRPKSSSQLAGNAGSTGELRHSPPAR